jgi:hypothetical protein
MVLLSAQDVQVGAGGAREPSRHQMRRPGPGAVRAADGSRDELA